jgi:hypothetical protein
MTGTSIRELIHKFRFKTLMLLKLLLLQRKVMFYGQHVERLCTFQYSLVSLIPCEWCFTGPRPTSSLDSTAKQPRRCRLAKPTSIIADNPAANRATVLRSAIPAQLPGTTLAHLWRRVLLSALLATAADRPATRGSILPCGHDQQHLPATARKSDRRACQCRCPRLP